MYKTSARSFLLAVALAPSSVAGELSDRILVGYWHNWTSPNALRLTEVPGEFDVVNVAFATPTVPSGAFMQFTPDASIYPDPQDFIVDLRALQSQGRKVLISIGGGADPVHVDDANDVADFVQSMLAIVTSYGFDGMDIDLEGNSLSLDPGDGDFRAPSTPRIVHFIDAVEQTLAQLPPEFLLSAAPETAYVQGGYGTYAGVWGAYLPVLHALRDELDLVHVQHYNSGSMYGRDGNIYVPATADFHVAMADSLLAGFTVDRWGAGIFFEPLQASQVAIGLPATDQAAGSGYTPPAVVHQALDALYLGRDHGGSYTMADPEGYPGFRGLMTWSANWDVDGGQEFSREHRRYLDWLHLEGDAGTISAASGGTVRFELRAGRGNAGRRYFLLGSVTGTEPGTPLPGGHVVLPLNWDLFTRVVLQPAYSSVFQDFFGVLDAAGDGLAQLVVPPVSPGLVGLHMDYAFALASPWDFASNPYGVDIVH